jgi:hypothetical protein
MTRSLPGIRPFKGEGEQAHMTSDRKKQKIINIIPFSIHCSPARTAQAKAFAPYQL